jgi:hypothetical protein
VTVAGDHRSDGHFLEASAYLLAQSAYLNRRSQPSVGLSVCYPKTRTHDAARGAAVGRTLVNLPIVPERDLRNYRENPWTLDEVAV